MITGHIEEGCTMSAEKAAAFAKFQARAAYVRELIALFEMRTDALGNVVETNAAKVEQFYEQIELWDAEHSVAN